tara:strand:- start:446 stop:697 length:252 start_codon:yes stop_codon:yes gene_type:complete
MPPSTRSQDNKIIETLSEENTHLRSRNAVLISERKIDKQVIDVQRNMLRKLARENTNFAVFLIAPFFLLGMFVVFVVALYVTS